MDEQAYTLDQAAIFAEAAQAAAEIIQAAITAFEQLAETIRVVLAPMAASIRAFVRRIEREIVRCWRQLQRYSSAALPHNRYAMRARKIQRYARHTYITK